MSGDPPVTGSTDAIAHLHDHEIMPWGRKNGESGPTCGLPRTLHHGPPLPLGRRCGSCGEEKGRLIATKFSAEWRRRERQKTAFCETALEDTPRNSTCAQQMDSQNFHREYRTFFSALRSRDGQVDGVTVGNGSSARIPKESAAAARDARDVPHFSLVRCSYFPVP